MAKQAFDFSNNAGSFETPQLTAIAGDYARVCFTIRSVQTDAFLKVVSGTDTVLEPVASGNIVPTGALVAGDKVSLVFNSTCPTGKSSGWLEVAQ